MSEQRTAERLGRFLLGIGRSQRARELFERAAELDPSSSAARGGLARVAMREQRYEQAAELFREAAELEAPSSETLYGYAVVNLLRQDPPKLGQAEATLLRAVREDGPAPVLSRLAAVYAELDPSPERALALAKRAINAYPLSLHYRLRLAAILAGAGRRDDAVAEIERTRILAASRDGASNNLCWQGVLLGIAESVLPLCEQAVALEPDDYAERDTRGVARLATGDVEGGLEDLRFAVEHAPEGRERFLETRRAWIEALENGENPLTGERLRAFREDPLEGGLLWNY